MDECSESSSEFFVASRDSAELFDAAEKPLYEVTAFVVVLVVTALHPPVGFGGNHDLCPLGFNGCDKRIGIVGFIRSDSAGAGDCRQQGLRLADVAGLSGGEGEGC